jgi:hypothetical protein
MSHETLEYKDCIEACNTCADACDHCATACLDEEHVASMATCIRNDIDCAAICRLAAGFMARGSVHAKEVCALCAQICEACAAECTKHEQAHCKACAEACTACAKACRTMVG